jgi:hypothetical protein
MPTRRKPQLNHKSTDYAEVSDWLHRELVGRERNILSLVGFFEEFGDPNDPTYTGKSAAAELISEITGLLATALTIRLDAGYKAPSKVIATLKAIIKNPKLALRDMTEPEARGALAAAYHRDNEPPGTYWFDIYGEGGFEPDEKRIRMAAEKAIEVLQTQAAPGRPVAYDIQYLLPRLRGIFLRFNDKIARKSVLSSHGRGDFYQREDGAFFAFVEEVLAPIRQFLAALPNGGEVLVPELSAEYIARLAVDLSTSSTGAAPIYLYSAHRVEKDRLSIGELPQEGSQNLQSSRLRLLRMASFWRVMDAQRPGGEVGRNPRTCADS